MTQYVVAHVDIQDMETMKKYFEIVEEADARHGAKVIAGGPGPEMLEGDMKGFYVLLTFPDKQAVFDWYNNPENAEAHALRQKAAITSIALLPTS